MHRHDIFPLASLSSAELIIKQTNSLKLLSLSDDEKNTRSGKRNESRMRALAKKTSNNLTAIMSAVCDRILMTENSSISKPASPPFPNHEKRHKTVDKREVFYILNNRAMSYFILLHSRLNPLRETIKMWLSDNGEMSCRWKNLFVMLASRVSSLPLDWSRAVGFYCFLRLSRRQTLLLWKELQQWTSLPPMSLSKCVFALSRNKNLCQWSQKMRRKLYVLRWRRINNKSMSCRS